MTRFLPLASLTSALSVQMLALLDEIQAPVCSQHSFEVWKRTVPQAGKLTLGPGNPDANGRPVGIYGVAAKAL